jgi:hypothetical protein
MRVVAGWRAFVYSRRRTTTARDPRRYTPELKPGLISFHVWLREGAGKRRYMIIDLVVVHRICRRER